MNPNSSGRPNDEGKKDEGKLEKIANTIDPAGTEVTDDELIDPGANTRDFSTREKETNRNPPKPR